MDIMKFEKLKLLKDGTSVGIVGRVVHYSQGTFMYDHNTLKVRFIGATPSYISISMEVSLNCTRYGEIELREKT